MHWDSTPDSSGRPQPRRDIRQQTVADAREALIWDKFYHQHGHVEEDGEQLTGEERKNSQVSGQKDKRRQP